MRIVWTAVAIAALWLLCEAVALNTLLAVMVSGLQVHPQTSVPPLPVVILNVLAVPLGSLNPYVGPLDGKLLWAINGLIRAVGPYALIRIAVRAGRHSTRRTEMARRESSA